MQTVKTNVESTNCHNMRKWVPLSSEMRNDVDRVLLPDEMNQAVKEMQLTSAQTAVAADVQPNAVILIGAAGAGKTSILPRLHSYLPVYDSAKFFLHDGDLLRRYHGGFQRSCCEAGVGYIGSWDVVKPHIKAAKDMLLKRAIRERRNVLITTGQYSAMYVEMMTAASYKVHIIGIFVDCDTLMTRGVKRAQETGREYLGNVEKWERASRHMFHRVRDVDPTLPTSGLAVLLDNRDFNNPALLTVDQMRDLLLASKVPLEEKQESN